jgi:hypothetical protein
MHANLYACMHVQPCPNRKQGACCSNSADYRAWVACGLHWRPDDRVCLILGEHLLLCCIMHVWFAPC